MNWSTPKIILIAVVLTATSCFNKSKPAASDTKETVQAPEPTEIPTSKEALLAPFEAIKKEKPVDSIFVFYKDGNVKIKTFLYPDKKLAIKYYSDGYWGGDKGDVWNKKMVFLDENEKTKGAIKANYFDGSLSSIYESNEKDSIFKIYDYSSDLLQTYSKYHSKGPTLRQFYKEGIISRETLFSYTDDNKIIKDIRKYYPYVKITQEICEPTQGWGMKCPSDPAYGDSKLIEALAIFRGMLGEQ